MDKVTLIHTPHEFEGHRLSRVMTAKLADFERRQAGRRLQGQSSWRKKVPKSNPVVDKTMEAEPTS
jgi:hypothetical protein